MGYRVEYGYFKYDKLGKSKTKAQLVGTCAAIFALFLLTLFVSYHNSQLKDALFPFLKPHVQEAFTEMILQIGEGTSVRDAAGTFCREIVIENED